MSYKNYTVAIAGNYNSLDNTVHQLEFARILGSHIARLGGIVAIDTKSGFGMWTSLGALEVGGVGIGFSPASNKYEHENHYRLSTENLSTVVYTGFGYLGSGLVMLRSVDCVVVFLGDETVGQEIALAKELQKPLIVISLGKNEEEVQNLLGNAYEYAEIYTNQQDILIRLQSLIS